jgi:hypothetical protein
MTEVWSLDYGVNVAARSSSGRMSPEQRDAHARLAALPTIRHSRTERDVSEQARAKAELSERLRRARLNSGAAYNNAPREFGQGAKRPTVLVGRAQRLAILDALREGTLSADEITARFSCQRPSARIADLRDAGHEIDCERVETGERVVYRYRLIAEAKR